MSLSRHSVEALCQPGDLIRVGSTYLARTVVATCLGVKNDGGNAPSVASWWRLHMIEHLNSVSNSMRPMMLSQVLGSETRHIAWPLEDIDTIEVLSR